MATTAAPPSKVTYTTANVDWEAFHRQFDEALAGVRGQLGRDYALYIGGEPITSSAAPIVDTSPIDREIVLGRFASAGVLHVDRAVAAARAAQRGWAHTPWRARVATLRGAARRIRQRKFKPAEEAPWTGLKLYEVYRDAGLPAGVFNYLPGSGEVAGETLWRHSGVDGVVFTGSKAVGMHIFQGLSRDWIKPCLLEMGGKNAAIVLDSADLDAAAEGVTRSAFGLQNQKCSATSRVYVHTRVAQPFVEMLVERTKALKLGDPTERDVVFGPVINAAAGERDRRASSRARRGAKSVGGADQRCGG